MCPIWIGWVFDVLVTAAGAGAAWLAYRQSRQKMEPAPVEKTVSKLPAKTSPKGKAKKTLAKKKA